MTAEEEEGERKGGRVVTEARGGKSELVRM